MPSSRDERDVYRPLRQAGMLATIPMLLVAGPLVGFFGGRFLDRRMGIAPWGLVGGSCLGLLASVRETIRMIRRTIRENQDGA